MPFATSMKTKPFFVGLVAQFVFIDDFGRYVSEFDLQVFRSHKWHHEIKIGDVDGHEFCIGSGDDAIEQEFGDEHLSCWSSHFTGVVDLVSADGESHPVGIIKLFRANNAHEASLSDVFLAFLWYFVFKNESDRFCAFDSSSYPICEVPKFVGRGLAPNLGKFWCS